MLVDLICRRNRINRCLLYTSYVAAQAAYTGGNEWLTLVLDQIEENYQYLKAELAEKLPEAGVTPLEGTYLCWINLEAYVSADAVSYTHLDVYKRQALNLSPSKRRP